MEAVLSSLPCGPLQHDHLFHLSMQAEKAIRTVLARPRLQCNHIGDTPSPLLIPHSRELHMVRIPGCGDPWEPLWTQLTTRTLSPIEGISDILL